MLDPRRYHEQFLELIEEAETRDPRSLQKEIGPSGIGEECIHCLGCMIAQLPKNEVPEPGKPSYAWARRKGKQMHKYMEELLEEQNRAFGDQRWLLEQRVMVGKILDKEVWGSADCFDTKDLVVSDWKMVGESTRLKVAKGIVEPKYLIQPNLYGQGFVNAGYQVKGTLLLFFPIERNDLKYSIPVFRPFEPDVAEKAMKRANDIASLIQERGVDYVIPRLRRKEGCLDCKRYPM